MPTFNQMNKNRSYASPEATLKYSDKATLSQTLAKVFGAMFLGLLITAVVALGLAFGFSQYLNSVIDDVAAIDNATMIAIVTILVSAIGLIVMSFVLPITFAKGRHNITVPYVIYTVLMGIMLSCFAFALPWWLLGLAFGLTSLTFGVMALLGVVSKGRMSGAVMMISGLLSGILIICLANFLLMFIAPELSNGLSWIVSFALFAVILLITMVDVRRIKDIAATGETNNNNVVLYCAYILYSDFIAIFIRILYYLLIIFSKNRS